MAGDNDGLGATSETNETEEVHTPVPGVDFLIDLDRLRDIDINAMLSLEITSLVRITCTSSDKAPKPDVQRPLTKMQIR